MNQHTNRIKDKERKMSKVCEITGTRPLSGNNVSHANNKTKRKQLPNLQKKRIWLEEEKKWVTVKLTTKALKTLDKKGTKGIIKV